LESDEIQGKTVKIDLTCFNRSFLKNKDLEAPILIGPG